MDDRQEARVVELLLTEMQAMNEKLERIAKALELVVMKPPVQVVSQPAHHWPQYGPAFHWGGLTHG